MPFFRKRPAKNEPATSRYIHGNNHLIELRQVVKSYKTGAGVFTAVKSIDLTVGQGEFVAVIGKSGSGKSTLINMITGIDRPTSGEVLIGDTAVHTLDENRMAMWRGRNIGVVFQFFQLLPTLTVLENIMLPMDFCHTYSFWKRKGHAMQLLDQVGLADQAHKLPSTLSGGQQQRAAIARALANDPPILVADEPTGNLDSRTAAAVFRLFEDLVRQGKTIVMVTHDADLARRVTRTVILVDGEIVEEYLARVFPTLTEDQLARYSGQIQRVQFPAGAVIVRQGEMGDKFYLITRGRVEVALEQPDGQEIIVNRLGSGQFFGEIALLRGGERAATVRADPASDVQLAVLDRPAFEALLGESEDARQQIEEAIAERDAHNRRTLQQKGEA